MAELWRDYGGTMAGLWRDYGGTMAIVPPSRCAHGVATEYAPYAPDTARGYLIYAGHGVPTDWRTVRCAHRAGVFNEPFAVSPIESANGSHD